MGFETPSDRLTADVKRFFLLRPLDGFRLLRAIWILTLAIFGMQLLNWAVSIPSYVSHIQGVWRILGAITLAPIGPLLSILIVRLVLEVCSRVLHAFPYDAAEASE